jgi:hypothetical protein
MFGLINENILTTLETTYKEGKKKEFGNLFKSYTNILKTNRDVNKLREFYKIVDTTYFNDKIQANIFLEETLKEAAKLNLEGVNDLKKIVNNASADNIISERIKLLDKLIFDNPTLKENIETKYKLIEELTTEPPVTKTKEELTHYIKILDKKTDKILSKLSESAVNIVTLFIEGDVSKITNSYNELIETTIKIVDSKINENEDINITKKLITVRTELINMSENTNPKISDFENILSLNEALSSGSN